MDALIELFGEYEFIGVSVYKWFMIIGAAIFILRKLKQVMKMITDIYASYQDRENELNEAIKGRHEIQAELKRLAKVQAENTEKLLRFEAEIKSRDRNKLKSNLLSWFHYYTNDTKNPQHAWTEMEADVFWSSFSDYEKLNGNGFMHSDVQPAMNALEVIRMDDQERLASLYASRTS